MSHSTGWDQSPTSGTDGRPQPVTAPAAPAGPSVATVVHGLILLVIAVAILVGFLAPHPDWAILAPVLAAGLGLTLVAVAGATAVLRRRSRRHPFREMSRAVGTSAER
ncbi:hypothetical protein [Rudaeicoccus suwonensis]|uniref:Uncharacterized protein n=1 Tax=Rudaeicoccus suwonensis TaxID=657409 RepID=A0A561E8I3_9MICO|nr:hypothetical protein [Rudaeicoccus suwonensis]TWE11917.1 hypothetical protein BKA23_0710 [Rudaeicoccus suwonensis]